MREQVVQARHHFPAQGIIVQRRPAEEDEQLPAAVLSLHGKPEMKNVSNIIHACPSAARCICAGCRAGLRCEGNCSALYVSCDSLCHGLRYGRTTETAL